MTEHEQSRRIRILRDDVARKIAAGEVIDRPFSIVRELLDNALDAHAATVDVYLEQGGLARIRVVDDGDGMGREDLELSWRPHATSKIETEDDLLRVSSLGFRGEALSSIALCSRLLITSSTDADAPAWRLEAQGGRQLALEATRGRRGTSVEVEELFFNFPARKKFLKSASAESGLCRSVFVDRAVAYPRVAFRLFSENQARLSLPAADSVSRVAQAYSDLLDARLLAEAGEEGQGFSVRVIAGTPEVRRRDRKLLQCFVNGRRVSEFSLLQAAEYGFSGYVPGGWHPVAFVFVEVDPSLVDFNIHPAKKEVRFRNLPEVHRTVVAAVRKLLAPVADSPRPPAAAWSGPAPSGDWHRSPASGPEPGRAFSLPFTPDPVAIAEPAGDIRFLGQAFGVFLLFELPGRLLMLDQHAAHERILYERLLARAPAMQDLLFPLCFDVTADEESRLTALQAELETAGIQLRRAGSGSMEVVALAADLKPLPETALVEIVKAVNGEQWRQSLLATAACRLAIKEGDRVDPVTARELCSQALALAVPRCPHGRPIWHELSRDQLLKAVDRPV
ncbi:MAG TPA: DNA mismatch repair endonuclease MutL [Spirochaetia bacterium]|nr:DNA mismatch repair endonuclease MutL [Spirochaetia bacterium]